MEIFVTADYDKFHFLSYNRAVGTNRMLSKSIEKLDLTPYCPIIVDKQMNIIDGQNRFSVCKEKKMPIYYVVYNGDPEQAMKVINTCASPWRQEEWFQYYVSKDYPLYVELKQFMEETKLSLVNAILVFSDRKTGSKPFKEGKLQKAGNYHKEIVEFLNYIKPLLPKYYSFRPFVGGVVSFFDMFGEDKKRISKLKKKIAVVPRLSKIDDFVTSFVNITA